MNPLESRKQLLIAESELNRTYLVGNMATMTAGVCTLTDRAQSFGTIASSAAALATGLGARQHRKSTNIAKSSWTQIILEGTALISTLWLTFRTRSQ